MISIDKEKCTGCGLCKADCFPQNLEIINGTATAKGSCMECGHCYSICPAGAVTIDGCPTDGVIELSGEPAISGDTFLKAIKSRRSIRHFTPKPLSSELLSRVLEAGRFTATAANRQDVRYIVVQDSLAELKPLVWDGFRSITARSLVRKDPMASHLIDMYSAYKDNPDEDTLFFNAPALLIVLSPNTLNGGLASANIEMMAEAEGLGVLYSGYIQRSFEGSVDARQLLGIGSEEIICSCMLMGYPDVKYQRSAPRKEANIDWK